MIDKRAMIKEKRVSGILPLTRFAIIFANLELTNFEIIAVCNYLFNIHFCGGV